MTMPSSSWWATRCPRPRRGSWCSTSRRGTKGSSPVPLEVVPAARTVLLDGLPTPADVTAWRVRLEDLSTEAVRDALSPAEPAESVTIDVRYDGPDLDVVADAWACSVEAVVERHQETGFLVAFCGFAPGFAYCVPTTALPVVPRRSEPRERVAAGAVGLGASTAASIRWRCRAAGSWSARRRRCSSTRTATRRACWRPATRWPSGSAR